MGYWKMLKGPEYLPEELFNRQYLSTDEIISETMGDYITDTAREGLFDYLVETYDSRRAANKIMDDADWIEDQVDEFEDLWCEIEQGIVEMFDVDTHVEVGPFVFEWIEENASANLKTAIARMKQKPRRARR